MADDSKRKFEASTSDKSEPSKLPKLDVPEGPSKSEAVRTPVPTKSDTTEQLVAKPVVGKNLKETKVSMTIKNSSILKPYSQASARPKQTPERRPPGPATNWFKELGVNDRIEYDDGGAWIIDVQPDLRFPFSYIWQNIVRKYPALDVRGHPMVSSMSLIAYCQILFAAQHYFLDQYYRPITSIHCNRFHSDMSSREYADRLIQARVPPFMETLLLQVASVQDPARHDFTLIPSFAGFSWKHDFGRTVPASIFLAAHDRLARTRTNAEVETVMRQIYNTPVVNVDGTNYRVTHFFGGPYQGQNRPEQFRNWLSDKFETLVNPVINRVLSQRPTLSRINLLVPVLQSDDMNPYAFLTCYHDDNATVMLQFISALTLYFEETESSSRTLGEVLAEASGLSALTHSIEGATLPTWHSLGVSEDDDVTPVPASTFATKIHFLTAPPSYSGLFRMPAAGTFEENLYLVRPEKVTADTRVVKYTTFDKRRHLKPVVFWMQPYTRLPGVISYSLTLGYKIEVEEIDGVSIPLPNLRASLRDNNSQFIQGSVRTIDIHPVLNTGQEADQTRIIRRSNHEESSCGLALRDMSRNVLPIFGNEGVRAEHIRGLVHEQHHDDPRKAATYVGWRHGEEMPLPERSLYLWSSYRHVTQSNRLTRKVFMYYTLRGMYGLDSPLSRTANPVDLLPP